jgi:hypothetical protein
MFNHQAGLIGLCWLYGAMDFICKDINNGNFCNKPIVRSYVNMSKKIKVSTTFVQNCKWANCFSLHTPNQLNLAMF